MKQVNKIAAILDRMIMLCTMILACILICSAFVLLVVGRKEFFDIYQAVINNKVAVCHINLDAYPSMEDLQKINGYNVYIRYETEDHVIKKERQINYYVSLTADPQPKAEYYYNKIRPTIYISLPWNGSKTQYDIPMTALNVKYDRRFPFKPMSCISNLGHAEPYYMRYSPDTEQVYVWAYTGDGSNRLRLYRLTPVFRTDISTIECVNGEIWVPYHTDRVLSKLCKQNDI